MTRIEKYAEYRKKILNEGNFLSHIDNESSIIKSYRDKIMSLNPNILINESEDIKGFSPVVPLTSINQMDPTMFQRLKNFSDLVDVEKEKQIKDDISNFIFSYEHNSIIDNNSKSISHDWLIQDKNYLDLEKIDKNLKKAQDELIEFEKVSVQKLSKLMETVKNSDNSKLDIEKFKVSQYVVNTSLSYKKFYIALIWILLFLIISIVIIVVVGVLFYVK